MSFMRIGRGLALLAGVALFLVGAAGPALAQGDESREISDRWNIRLGSAYTSSATDIAAGDTIGALVRIEDVFGFDKQESSLGLEGWYRFKAKKKGVHRLWFSYTTVSREAAGSVNASVPIFDLMFDADFASEFDTSLFQLQYKLSLIKTDRGEAGIQAGLSIFDYEFQLSGSANDGMGGPSAFASEQADVLAPIPTFGFFVTYAITPKLIFNTSMSSLDISIGGVEGRILNTNAQLTWYFIRHLGVGIGIASSNLNVTDEPRILWIIQIRAASDRPVDRCSAVFPHRDPLQ